MDISNSDKPKNTSRRVISEIAIDEGMTYSCNDYYNPAADKLLTKCDSILTIAQAAELLIRKQIAYNNGDKTLPSNTSTVLRSGIGVLEEMLIDPKSRQMHMLRAKTIKGSLKYRKGEKILDFHNFDLDYTLKKFNLEGHMSRLEGKTPEDKRYFTTEQSYLVNTYSFDNNPHGIEFMKWALGPKLSNPENTFFKDSNVWYVQLKNAHPLVYDFHKKQSPLNNAKAYINNNRQDLPFLRSVSVRLDEEVPSRNPKIYRLVIQVQGINNSQHPLAGIVYNRKRSSK